MTVCRRFTDVGSFHIISHKEPVTPPLAVFATTGEGASVGAGDVEGIDGDAVGLATAGGYIAHGKNIKNLKETTNNTGVVDLALDWYAISLANHILSWRRDTHLISTFAQSAQRLSGNTESTSKNKIENEGGTRNTHYHGIGHGRGSRGHNMYFGRNNPFLPQWREYW